MKLFKQLKLMREENLAATRNSQALVEELDRTAQNVEEQHKEAVDQLKESKKRALILKDADRRNHYSEGLTKSFRGEATA